MLKRRRVLLVFIAVMLVADLVGLAVLRDAWQSRQDELTQKKWISESRSTHRSSTTSNRESLRPAP